MGGAGWAKGQGAGPDGDVAPVSAGALPDFAEDAAQADRQRGPGVIVQPEGGIAVQVEVYVL